MRTYLNDLNEAQRAAVEDFKGPSLVIAGAGSGKTRVLTYRIAHLLSHGIRPASILALTFTNKAAGEMKERIGKLVGDDLAKNLWMGTFHSIFARILRLEGNLLGYPSSYTIYDTTDTKNLLKIIIKEKNLDDQVYKGGEIAGRISFAKNNLITPKAYLASNQLIEQDKRSRRPLIGDIYMKYAARLKKADAMDFDDLLLNTYILFRDHPQTLEKYQKMFSYILVDEYQDTNYVQYMIINQLAAIHKNICVVGDDAQSIYSFRGARIENILNFQHDYKDYKLFKLEQNYRSTKNIVDAANSLISNNKGQISKKIWSGNESGEKIRLIRAATDNEEGFLVSNLVQDTIYSEQLQYRDFAILYRTNAQSRIFEESLRKLNIPYRVYGSLSFYQRKEIKDLLAYFRLTVNPFDEEALLRIINYPPRGIGTTTISKLEGLGEKTGKRLWIILSEIRNFTEYFNRGTIAKLESFYHLISSFRKNLATMEAFDLAFSIAESTGILKDLHYEKSPENLSKFENIQELLNGIKEFTESQTEGEKSTLDTYLQTVVLLTDLDTDKDEDRNKVTIMTIHSAKGLEFRHVFVTGLEEDLFPSRLSSSTREELEEERRLFYVAVTRAMKKVILTFAESRYKWGILLSCTPSRFIREIDPGYFEKPVQMTSLNHQSFPNGNAKSRDVKYTRRNFDIKEPELKVKRLRREKLRPVDETLRRDKDESSFDFDNPSKIQVGMEVEHPRFGKGKVLNIEGDLTNKKATVYFQTTGQKQLLLKFAKLRIIKSFE
ncbi:MAG: ATP-dependent DNA helicase [Bacteroides sp. SM23_62_1]|nr:MAG: ATP-dependent DNA helicase [Bacteroides sp. SM23_62_1]